MKIFAPIALALAITVLPSTSLAAPASEDHFYAKHSDIRNDVKVNKKANISKKIKKKMDVRVGEVELTSTLFQYSLKTVKPLVGNKQAELFAAAYLEGENYSYGVSGSGRRGKVAVVSYTDFERVECDAKVEVYNRRTIVSVPRDCMPELSGETEVVLFSFLEKNGNDAGSDLVKDFIVQF